MARKKAPSKKKYGSAASKSVEREMKAYKKGKLKSGRSGATVKSRKQAIAIGLSEARARAQKCPRHPEKRLRRRSLQRKKSAKKVAKKTSSLDVARLAPDPESEELAALLPEFGRQRRSRFSGAVALATFGFGRLPSSRTSFAASFEPPSFRIPTCTLSSRRRRFVPARVVVHIPARALELNGRR